jgi:hypothetical protein
MYITIRVQLMGIIFPKEVSTEKDMEEEDIDNTIPIYGDTKGFIDMETSLKWGEVYHMFSN